MTEDTRVLLGLASAGAAALAALIVFWQTGLL